MRPPTRDALLGLGTVKIFEAGETILRQGDESTHVVLLLHGSAKVQAVSAAGGFALLGVRFGGDLVGEMAAMEQRPRSAMVTAGTRARAKLVKSADFNDFLHRHADASFELTRMVNERLRWANRRRVDNAQHSAPDRVQRVLLEVMQTYGVLDRDGSHRLGTPLSHDDLASLSGVRRRTVEKVLHGLEKQGIVLRRYRQVIVTDLDELRRLLGDSG
ncbi:MAG: Crp/Fnr family transcriptional regulator [Saccharopolyspora sp.]|uniref:Crp/Fnr family transcriptional regulator n=1 Tax=Saccharopolyspora TaxID=1835 RepID=UPI00190C20BF|nr:MULTISPECIES: Crp/Fnr family transcriptional regulator [unclassified Saccharopolyspora]MBK0866126.1 Crp/Fnr family transcriptional regulator [Saccharopolyspora sp. HNM0986]MBQ6639597.1 Crp/Fnr family transcriptional regulator [Saccharopolyspora sp.]